MDRTSEAVCEAHGTAVLCTTCGNADVEAADGTSPCATARAQECLEGAAWTPLQSQTAVQGRSDACCFITGVVRQVAMHPSSWCKPDCTFHVTQPIQQALGFMLVMSAGWVTTLAAALLFSLAKLTPE